MRNRTVRQHDPRDPDADVWWSWPSGWATYCALHPVDPSTVAELVVRTDYVRSTIYRTLKRLRDQYGLASVSAAGWCRLDVEVDDWDFVRWGAKAARYRVEREIHAVYVASRFGAAVERTR